MTTKLLTNSVDLEKSTEELSTLPYRRGNFASRNWGHEFHFLVSYPSKLKPSIAYHLIKLFTKEGEIVLDPFSGVGTIPFEACSQGRIGYGSDISPVAYHATSAKVDPPSIRQAERQLDELETFIEHHKKNIEVDVEKEIVSYYHPETLKEILAAKKFFENTPGKYYSFLIACTLHILHGNRPYALSRRSHNIMPWPPKGEFIYKPLMRSLREKVHRMLEKGLPLGFVRGKAFQEDVFNLSFPDSSVDCIITSPPFYSNRDFLRMNRIRLWFCGWNYSKQNEMKTAFLEHQKDLSIYRLVFRQFYRILKNNRLCIMHMGVVKNIDMALAIAPYAQAEGFEIVSTIYEDTSHLESHGITDRGAAKKHQFLILRKV